ncbi:MAG: hypothetical protein V3T41_07085 [bacterium]
MTRVGVCLIVATSVLAAAVWAGVGDVISSFRATYGTLYAGGVYRDDTYVYVAFYTTGLFQYYMKKYTPAGSYVGVIALGPAWHWPLTDADHSRRGAGYVTIATDANVLFTFDLSTGYRVESINLGLYDIWGYAYRSGARYAFASEDSSQFIFKYDASWSVVSSFRWGGALAATDRYKGRPGDYVIVDSTPARVYTGDGSLVGTFPNGRDVIGRGCVCGRGYPASWGTTYWRYEGWSECWVYQIDLGNTTAVAPASVGRIKALYR